jgi:tetratricopeptide (TPR) repeat protein
MKVAVYTIAKNEEQFVERWYQSAKEADYLLIADTGSTDKTVEKATALGIVCHTITINPWRFDDARNVSLALVPADVDYCIALDMDEILLPGWREELEKAHTQGWTRPRYKYTWSWKPNREPGLQYGGDKIHARKGYRWRHPVHEVITSDRILETQGWTSLEIHHHPDDTKSRGQYFGLLELSVLEDPTDDRNAFYFARELYYHGLCDRALEEFKRHLALPKARWAPERAASWRYMAKCDPDNAIKYLIEASKEAPEFREPWVELANAYYKKEDWDNCYASAKKALEIKEKPLAYLNDADAWGSLPHDLLALSAFKLGKIEEAIDHGQTAVELSPDDQRLKTNLVFYQLEETK